MWVLWASLIVISALPVSYAVVSADADAESNAMEKEE